MSWPWWFLILHLLLLEYDSLVGKLTFGVGRSSYICNLSQLNKKIHYMVSGCLRLSLLSMGTFWVQYVNCIYISIFSFPHAVLKKWGMYVQDNNITFWQNLVHNFFEPGALKRWCLSSYNTSPVGRHAQGLFPMVGSRLCLWWQILLESSEHLC